MKLITRTAAYVRMHGLRYTVRRAGEMLRERVLHTWHRAWQADAQDEQELARQRAHQPWSGLISVVIPVYNTRPAFLRELCASLQAQTYANWEAILYDGCSTREDTRETLASLGGDARIRIIYGEANEGISGNTNRALALAWGEYVALCDHDDLLSPDALWHMADCIASKAPDVLYSDEDKLTEDGRFHTDPHFKPDFCPDHLRSGNYVCHLLVARKALVMRLGGLRSAFDGSQDHDLMLRLAEATDRICHVPRVLYHWRTVGSSMSHQQLARCQDAAARAVTEHMGRIGYPGDCTVEDGVLRLRWQLKPLTVCTIRVPGQDRYAFMNRAAAQAGEDVLLFVDERATPLAGEAVQELLMYAQRSDVGAVTPAVTDRRGRMLHAGFAVGACGVLSRNRGLPYRAGGWHGMNRTAHNVSAVSAGCFMIRRECFLPFDESYRDGLGAVEWCMRLQQNGLRHVYTPHARVTLEAPELTHRWTDEAKFLAAWQGYHDPCCALRQLHPPLDFTWR